MQKIKNSGGSIWYGLHMYPGVAEYQDAPGAKPYRVYLCEDAIRKMDPTFAGKPVYVKHVDEVPSDKEELRQEADGWVTESFYNQADGKHWVKFIVVTQDGEEAIKRKWSLSNCYIPTSTSPGGLWNAVSYEKEITDGEYEHLAIVPNPRYEESVILSPDEFKEYNVSKIEELKRLSNNTHKEKSMKFSFFKRTKVEGLDLDGTAVVLPKSGVEMTISKLINEMDSAMVEKKEPVAEMDKDDRKVEDTDMTIAQMWQAMKEMYNDLMKAKKKKENDEEYGEEEDEADEDMMINVDRDPEDLEEEIEEVREKRMAKEPDIKSMDNKRKNKSKMIDEDMDEEVEMEKKEKKANAKVKADRLKNAHFKASLSAEPELDLSMDQVARGKVRYGSSN